MIDDDAKTVGTKCARLLALRRSPRLGDRVPPTVPISASAAAAYARQHPTADHAARVDGFAAWLREHPEALVDPAPACGPAPWIVRSSGDEDDDDRINAGGYASLVCEQPEALPRVVAEVAFSGYEPRALAQRRLSSPHAEPFPIPCFVQPLVEARSDRTPEPGTSPWLPRAAVDALAGDLAVLHEELGLDALDSEWVLRTDVGLVSATALTRRRDGSLEGQLAFGFGHAAAQTPGHRGNSTVFLLPGATLRPWSGDLLQRAEPRERFVIQARPARYYALRRACELPTPSAIATLEPRATSCSVREVIHLGHRGHGPVLAHPTLAGAWSAYLELPPEDRSALSLVLVEEGVATEHAGIMAQHAGLTCLRVALTDLPAGSTHAALEPALARLFIGDARISEDLATEPRQLLVLPARCHVIFDRTDHHAEIHAALDALRAGLEPALPPGLPLAELPAASRLALVERSLWPDPDAWLHEGSAARSPSLVGRAIEARLAAAPELPGPAATVLRSRGDVVSRYVDALAVTRGERALETVLPLAAHADPDALRRGVPADDLRLVVALAELEASEPTLPPPAWRRLVRALATQRETGSPHAARDLLAMIAHLLDDARSLSLHTVEERAALLDALLDGLEDLDAPRRERWATLLGRTQLPAEAGLAALRASTAHEALEAALSGVERAREALLGAAAVGDVAARGRALLGAYEALRRACPPKGALGDVLELVRNELVEAYDATLKAILVGLRPDDPTRHARYVALLEVWLGFVALHPIEPSHRHALESFAAWLRADGAVPTAEVELVDEHWRHQLQQAAEAPLGQPPLDNPHQLHNLVHRWLLATTRPLQALALPGRLAELVRFNATFSGGQGKLLRLTRRSFELELPMGTHKASFSVEPERVVAEWHEPPDVPDDELGRLRLFEVLVAGLAEHQPGLELRAHRERVVGTWTLRVRASASSPRPLSFDEQRAVILGLRTIFDIAYDCSYLADDEVEDTAEWLGGPTWRALFPALVEYRADVDDRDQHEHLYALPPAIVLHCLLREPGLREHLDRLVHADAAEVLAAVDRETAALEAAHEPLAWCSHHRTLRQLALLAAARFPAPSLARLRAATAPPHRGDELLAACVLRRRSVQRMLPPLALDPPAPEGLASLVLRHCPAAALDADNAPRVARRLTAQPGAFRRGKQLLLARFADAIDPDACASLVAELELVPWGREPPQEQALQRALATVGPRARFSIAHGVDFSLL